MIEAHKAIRKRLKNATLTEYNNLITEAKLTPTQVAALRYHIIQGKTLIETACELNCCERTVAGILRNAYEKLKKAGITVQA